MLAPILQPLLGDVWKLCANGDSLQISQRVKPDDRPFGGRINQRHRMRAAA